MRDPDTQADEEIDAESKRVLSLLEQPVVDLLEMIMKANKPSGIQGLVEMAVNTSIGISIKRIADALENKNKENGQAHSQFSDVFGEVTK